MEDVEAAREMWLDAFERAAEKSEQRPDTW
jgi:hypothetical protein